MFYILKNSIEEQNNLKIFDIQQYDFIFLYSLKEEIPKLYFVLFFAKIFFHITKKINKQIKRSK